MSESLLPPNASRFELATEAAMCGPFEVDVPIDTLRDPDRCPAMLLGWLAWELSVDTWDDGWIEETRRGTLRASVEVHRLKGTVASLKTALAAAGYGDARIVEQWGNFYDGTHPRNGSIDRMPAGHWAAYRVILTRPISIEQAAQVREILGTVEPARCTLDLLIYPQALHLYDGQLQRDGVFTRGAA